jgi:hypothetical protein
MFSLNNTPSSLIRMKILKFRIKKRLLNILAGKKNLGTVANAFPHFESNSLTIQEEEVLRLLTGSESSSISTIK